MPSKTVDEETVVTARDLINELSGRMESGDGNVSLRCVLGASLTPDIDCCGMDADDTGDNLERRRDFISGVMFPE